MALASFGAASAAHAAIIMEWDATSYTPGMAWTQTAAGGSDILVGGADAENIQKISGESFGAGQSIDFVRFSGAQSFDQNNINHPLAGLQAYSISAVYRSTDTGMVSTGNVNNFYQYNGIVGKEVGGGGVGDWGIGIYDDGKLGAGVALGGGDNGVGTAASVNGTGFHTFTQSIQNNGDNTFNLRLFQDGALANELLNIGYGGTTSIRATNWAVGAIRDGENAPFYTGDLAHLRFDNTALLLGDVSGPTGLHANFLGTVSAVPEPSSFAILGLAAVAGIVIQRRRSAKQ